MIAVLFAVVFASSAMMEAMHSAPLPDYVHPSYVWGDR